VNFKSLEETVLYQSIDTMVRFKNFGQSLTAKKKSSKEEPARMELMLVYKDVDCNPA
jgi:hypothetical protein